MAKLAILEVEATVTERGQTTIPAAIRKVLALRKHDHIVFRSLADGTVVVEKKDDTVPEDLVLRNFLDFIANDILTRPQAMSLLPDHFAEDHRHLSDIEIDLDEPLVDDEA
ncbi:type II toxin-antitoxin system PrlF family antitoxin [Microvirga pudoricolor]|uniref:type II toxin-antitoxin system PrlF family antitoxin n=1 Tax=Microvirga pudoricolor TaxID=2778729 RepID=UPI00194DAFC3|nr:type II toxin-antitoxin system PrlF family antitoxin [Microvirga pudoricolor]MBM6594962.1 type II toxin-antitoxin system PrlF family antitoxin [Microvirga pudoricolor]